MDNATALYTFAENLRVQDLGACEAIERRF